MGSQISKTGEEEGELGRVGRWTYSIPGDSSGRVADFHNCNSTKSRFSRYSTRLGHVTSGDVLVKLTMMAGVALRSRVKEDVRVLTDKLHCGQVLEPSSILADK